MGSIKNGLKHTAIKPDAKRGLKKVEKNDLEKVFDTVQLPNWKSSKPKPLTNAYKIFVERIYTAYFFTKSFCTLL